MAAIEIDKYLICGDIEIIKCHNGFIIKPAVGISDNNRFISINSFYCFETKESLLKFLNYNLAENPIREGKIG